MAVSVVFSIAMTIAVAISTVVIFVLVLAVVVSVVVMVLGAHLRAVEVLFPADVPAPIAMLSPMRQRANVAEARIVGAINLSIDA